VKGPEREIPLTVIWSDRMLAKLQQLRDAAEPLLICAEEIGVSYETAVHKARELGLADRLNRGRRPGRRVLLEEREVLAEDAI
jgi:hypothetical protein